MAHRRQGLSQRRKAVGLTQESLADLLGVERSTVVRWEAGDTEPLPSIRPHVARALHVSIDQLAELLTESENADTTRGLLADTEVTIPVPPSTVPPSKVAPSVPPSRPEFEDALGRQVAETVEVLRRVLLSAGVGPAEFEAMLLASRSARVPLASAELGHPINADPEATVALGAARSGRPVDIAHPAGIDTASTDVGPATPVPTTVPTTVETAGSVGSDIPEPAQAEVSHRPAVTTIALDVKPADVQQRRTGPRRFTRFAVAGVLALAGVAASVPLLTSHSGPIPPTAADASAPATSVAAIPAPGPGNGNSRSKDSTEAIHAPPATPPQKPVDGPATPGADIFGVAVMPAPRTPEITTISQTINQSKPPAAVTPPPRPRAPAVSAEDQARVREAQAYARSRKAEAYARSRKAVLSAREQYRERLRSESASRP